MMTSPQRIDFTSEEIEALIDRLDRRCLEEKDYDLLAEFIKALVWMNMSLQEKQLSIHRLRAIFGIKTESAKKIVELLGKKGKASGVNQQNSSAANMPSGDTEGKEGPTDTVHQDKTDETPKNGHGHHPSSDYAQAKV